MPESDIHRTVEAVWRIEAARLIAGLTRIVRDVGLAEELAQDAMVVALEKWPQSGVPDNPGAWLMATAKHRAIDALRRRQLHDRKEAELGRELEAARNGGIDIDEEPDDTIGDDLLRLLFISCHPVLSPEARAALTLRLLAGLTVAEIARAYLVPEATIAQRIVRAKRTLASAQIPFEVPRGSELTERVASVLEVIYLMFNEGYAATSGREWMRPELCEDALRLARMVAELVPEEAEAHGLAALLEIQASRLRARSGRDGEPILLLEQDRGRWDHLLINRGLAALDRAQRTGREPGAYVLQASIAACHARARTAEETDWIRIAALYEALALATPSPVVDLNRAVALGMAFGPQAGLRLVEDLREDGTLDEYHLLHSVHADLLEKVGRIPEAIEAFERAASLSRNEREQTILRGRAEQCRARIAPTSQDVR